jgi:hypothetical protein
VFSVNKDSPSTRRIIPNAISSHSRLRQDKCVRVAASAPALIARLVQLLAEPVLEQRRMIVRPALLGRSCLMVVALA